MRRATRTGAPPHLREDPRQLLASKRGQELVRPLIALDPRRPGMDDGVIVPGEYFALGTSVEAVRWQAADRAPLWGAVRVIVVLVDLDDQPFADGGAARQRF